MNLGRKVALNSAAQVGAQLFAMAAGLASVATAARYLSIDAYGEVIAAMVLVSLFSIATDFGVTTQGMRALARRPDDAPAITGGVMVAVAAFTVPTALLIFAASRIAYGGADDSLTRDAILLFLVPLALKPLRAAAQTHAVAEQRVYLASIAVVVARAATVAMVVAVAALDLGPLAMAAAYAGGIALDDLLTVALVRPSLRVPWRRALIVPELRWIVAGALPLGIIMVINGLYAKIDAVLLSLLSADADVALYGIAYRVFEMAAPLPMYVMITLAPELARTDPDDPRFGRLMQKAFSATWLLLALPLSAFALCAPEIMTVLGGEDYARGGSVLSLIIVSAGLYCLNVVLGNALVAQGRQGPLLKVAVTVLVLNVALNLVLIPAHGAVGAGIALLVTEVLSLTGTYWVFSRLAPAPRPHMPVRSLVALAAMLGAMSVKFVFDGALPALTAGALAGGLAYVAVLWAVRAVPDYLVEAITALRLRRRAGQPA